MIKHRGWGPWKKEWYSICSAHISHKESCSTCQKGTWVNVWKATLSRAIYKLFPKLWRKIVNRGVAVDHV